MPLGYRLGWLHSGGHAKIRPTTHLAPNAGLHVGAAIENLVGIDIARAVDRDLLDDSGAVDSGSGKLEIDDDRSDD